MSTAAPRVDPETGEILAEPAAPAGSRGIASVAKEGTHRAKLRGMGLFAGIAVLGFGFVYFVAPKPKSQAELAADMARRQSAQKINAEMPVPKLHVPPPAPVAAPVTDPAPSVVGVEHDGIAAAVLGDRPELPNSAAGGGSTAPVNVEGARGYRSDGPRLSHGRSALSSPVLYRSNSTSGSSPSTPGVMDVARDVAGIAGGLDPAPAANPAGSSALGNALKPTVTPAVRAERLPSRRWLLPKGAFADCTLETAIDSTLPGMTTCVLALDVFGADGTVVLLERGTRLVGEARADVRPGQSRVAVLWTEARTPTGVVAHLDSLGTDELGRSGVPGAVDTHFRERFGAAILISLIDSASQALSNSTSSGSGGIVLNPSRSTDVLTEILRQTIAIPPTIHVPQGARLQVFVARDVDFRPVYALKART
ncbi:MAG: type IV secretion system protein VirB10 [Cyanobacteria bacterium SZAS LIN-2]|nr:type IV secretion system protein VirB10 [Cyanobacteria bacterium SZAS LIN-2]